MFFPNLYYYTNYTKKENTEAGLLIVPQWTISLICLLLVFVLNSDPRREDSLEEMERLIKPAESTFPFKEWCTSIAKGSGNDFGSY